MDEGGFGPDSLAQIHWPIKMQEPRPAAKSSPIQLPPINHLASDAHGNEVASMKTSPGSTSISIVGQFTASPECLF
ncbi:hypothetical protein SDJN02_12961, partial [Cucurbita argyrosperma subsp. argyrosperma]